MPARVGFAAGALALALSTVTIASEPVTTLIRRLDLAVPRRVTTPPEFSGPTVDARSVALADLRGKVVLLNFWASWCVECRPEMPVLEMLHRELAPRGLAVVGINAREAPPAVTRYASELGLTFPLVLDVEGRTSERYGVIGLPTTFVIARDGRAVAFAVGPRDWGSAAARTLLQTLLAEPAPPAR
jgi:thiol-disulfide isomerase/thioredoxin